MGSIRTVVYSTAEEVDALELVDDGALIMLRVMEGALPPLLRLMVRMDVGRDVEVVGLAVTEMKSELLLPPRRASRGLFSII